MAVLLVPISSPPGEWLASFASTSPGLEVRVWPAIGEPADVEVLAVGVMPPAVLPNLPNLRLIVSLLAGQDSILSCPDLPTDVPIVRAATPGGDQMMNHTVLLHVLRHHTEMPHYASSQRRKEWSPRRPLASHERTIGVAGLGLIGLSAARALVTAGFNVRAWSRSSRDLSGITLFHGRDQLKAFLSGCEILVNLLPLTPETRNVFCAETLGWLPTGASLINLGRGDHIVDADLISALDSGHLSAATLDAFRTEPLSPESRLWSHDGITITPHVSRRLVPGALVPSICENIRRLRSGEPLLNLVDSKRGY